MKYGLCCMQANCLFPITLTCYLSFPRCRLQIPVLKKKKGWKPNLGATPVTSTASRYLNNDAATVVWLPPEATQTQAPSDEHHFLFWNRIQLIFWGGHEYFLLRDFLRKNVIALRFPRQAGQRACLQMGHTELLSLQCTPFTKHFIAHDRSTPTSGSQCL